MTMTTIYKRHVALGFIFLGLLAFSQPLWAQRPRIQFKVEAHDLGVLQEGEIVSRFFEFTNTGDAPLKIFETFGD